MSTRIYTVPIEQTRWEVPGGGATTVFNWEYDEPRDYLLNLYKKGKNKQWNATTRIDWSQDVDPVNPLGIPDQSVPIYGPEMWEKLSPRERGEVHRHQAAWRFSQFLHGEQGALICTAQIVQTVPDVDAKFYAATQVMDECVRYVESSPMRQEFTKLLFSRIVPTLKDIGLWGPKVQAAFVAMGVMRFADIDPAAKSEEDERVADRMEAELAAAREAAIDDTIAAGAQG